MDRWAILALVSVLLPSSFLHHHQSSFVEAFDETLGFTSPHAIEHSYKTALKDLGQKAREAGNPANMSDSCLNGYQTCLWEKGDNPIKELAQEEAYRRGVFTPQLLDDEITSPPSDTDQYLLAASLLAPPSTKDLDEELRMLPQAASQLSELYGEDYQAMNATTRADHLSSGLQAHIKSLQVLEEIRQGALVKAEALPHQVNDWVSRAQKYWKGQEEKKHPGYSHDRLDMGWRLATRAAEDQQEPGVQHYNMTQMDALLSWFETEGGKIMYATWDPYELSDGSEVPMLQATETIGEGDVVLQVPLKLTISSLTQRLVKTKRGLLKEYFDQVFNRSQEWGLAVFLLHELHKGSESRWYPFIQTFRMQVPRRSVLQELEGTYAGNLYRQWEYEAQALLTYLRRMGPCEHDFYGICDGLTEQTSLRWALWVVRHNSVTIRKATTGKEVLALVPFANLLRHERGAGGSAILTLDNTIKVNLGTHEAGDELVMDRGPLSDAECLFKFHEVDLEPERDNPYNAIHLNLPAVTTELDDIYHFVDRNREWRRLLRYPPKQIDLWIATNHLMLYGDADDEEEQRAVENANKLLAGQPVAVRSEEERLMLLGFARDEGEARQLIETSQGGKELMLQSTQNDSTTMEGVAPQLYLAVESDSEDDAASHALDTLSSAVLELQEAVAGLSPNRPEPSVEKCVNRTRDFFVHGIRPLRGIDEIDKMLKRKRHLLDRCGEAKTHVIKAGNASQELLCAVRVLFLNESDLDILCPCGDPPFNDMQCRCRREDHQKKCVDLEDYFNPLEAISRDNEAMALDVLIRSLEGLRAGYRTTMEEDEALLALTTFVERTPVRAAAVITRLREKRMLDSALQTLRHRRHHLLPYISYQVESIHERRIQQAYKEAARQEKLKALRSQVYHSPVLVNMTVDVEGRGSYHLTLHEGEAVDDLVVEFCRRHDLDDSTANMLKEQLLDRLPHEGRLELAMPVIDPWGVRRVVVVKHGENATQAALDFCLAFNVSEWEDDEPCLELAQKTVDMLRQRQEHKLILSIAVTLPDGRRVLLNIHEGEQHDIVTTVSNFALAYHLPDGFISGLADEVRRRLPPDLLVVPVTITGKVTVHLHITSPHHLDDTIKAFCQVYNIPLENVPLLRQNVLSGLNPDAFVTQGRDRLPQQ